MSYSDNRDYDTPYDFRLIDSSIYTKDSTGPGPDDYVFILMASDVKPDAMTELVDSNVLANDGGFIEASIPMWWINDIFCMHFSVYTPLNTTFVFFLLSIPELDGSRTIVLVPVATKETVYLRSMGSDMEEKVSLYVTGAIRYFAQFKRDAIATKMLYNQIVYAEEQRRNNKQLDVHMGLYTRLKERLRYRKLVKRLEQYVEVRRLSHMSSVSRAMRIVKEYYDISLIDVIDTHRNR